MKIHCLPDQGREKRWLERIVLCGFIQKFFKKYAAFFGRHLPQCAPQNQQVLRAHCARQRSVHLFAIVFYVPVLRLILHREYDSKR